MIDWDSFSIHTGECVRFEQLENTYVLNRVTGNEESAILGSLRSNGAVYLVNPNGILIGKEAYIDTAGFIASTLDILGSDLSSLQFLGDSEKGVVNQGRIHCAAGDVFLIGKTVENSGTIDAPQGRQGLLSGFDVLIFPEKAPQVRIRVEESVDADILKENPYALAICHRGKVLAKEVYLIAENGITEVTGTIVAMNGEQGGHVRVLGDEVLLLNSAKIDVSGKQGGGEALFGGDYQGKNPEIKNAKHLFVEKDVVIKASAKEAGNGGRVIFWSDEATIFYGLVDNRGGEVRGDGGFTEVSGGYLNFQGFVDGSSPFGSAGTLLLDPTNITISTGGDANGSFSAGIWTSTASTATINTTTLQTQLGSNNVTINTSGPFGSTGTIAITHPISWSSANNLTLIADASIAVSSGAAITCSSTGGVQMTAKGTGATGTGISLGLNAHISTTSGNIILNGTSGTGTSGSGITFLGTISSTTGTVSLTGTCRSTSTAPIGVSLGNSSAVRTTGGGSIAIIGTGSDKTAANSAHGVSIAAGAVVNTATGNGPISITGTARAGNASCGVRISSVTPGLIVSGTGTITIGGTSSATTAGSHGVSIAAAWTPATTGLVTLSGTGGPSGASHGVNIAGTYTGAGDIVFANCVGGSGGGNGINVAAVFTTTGTITATTNIRGNGSGGVGFSSGNTFSTSGINKSISITASAGGTLGACHGISLTAGTLSTTGGGSITLNGTGGASNLASHGVNITGGIPSVSTTTGNGNISITGTAQGSAASFGLNIGANIVSTSGTITVSGTSSATLGGSHGVSIAYWTPATTGLVTLSGMGGPTGASHGLHIGGQYIGVGNIVFINCVGGAGGGNGINVGAGFVTTGSITATTNIQGNGSGGIGFFCNNSFLSTATPQLVSITASATGNTGACHGISLTGACSLRGSAITLNGTGGPSDLLSHGVNITGGASTVSTTVSGNGPISITGTAAGSAASFGVNMAGSAANFVESGSGTITVSGISSSTAAGSHGVSISSAWAPATTGLVSLSGTGGGTGASCGIAIGANVTFSGAITINGTEGGGEGSFGNSFGGNVTTSAGTIEVFQSSTLAAATIIDSTNGGSFPGGALIDFSGGTATIDGAQSLTLVAGTSTISLEGAVGGTSPLTNLTFTSANLIELGSNITVSGANPLTFPFAVSITGTSTINTNNAALSFSSTINGAQSLTLNSGSASTTLSTAVGGITALNSFSATSATIAQGSSVTTIGPITYTGSTSINIQGDLTTTGGAISMIGPVSLTTSPLSFDTTNGSADGASIYFSSTLNGGSNVAFRAGTSGVVTFTGVVGGETPLGTVVITNAALSLGAVNIGGNITANSFVLSSASPVTLLGSSIIDTSAAAGLGIVFGSTIDGTTPGGQSLTLIANGADTITLPGNIGTNVRLGTLTIEGGTVEVLIGP